MNAQSGGDYARVRLLEEIRSQGKEWEVLAPLYGVTNPNPPWKTSLVGICESLSDSGALPSLERRHAEDELKDSVYGEVPSPESDLLALVHILLSRKLVTEDDLAIRMRAVRARVEAV